MGDIIEFRRRAGQQDPSLEEAFSTRLDAGDFNLDIDGEDPRLLPALKNMVAAWRSHQRTAYEFAAIPKEDVEARNAVGERSYDFRLAMEDAQKVVVAARPLTLGGLIAKALAIERGVRRNVPVELYQSLAADLCAMLAEQPGTGA